MCVCNERVGIIPVILLFRREHPALYAAGRVSNEDPLYATFLYCNRQCRDLIPTFTLLSRHVRANGW